MRYQAVVWGLCAAAGMALVATGIGHLRAYVRRIVAETVRDLLEVYEAVHHD